jgi:hypothetical protein
MEFIKGGDALPVPLNIFSIPASAVAKCYKLIKSTHKKMNDNNSNSLETDSPQIKVKKVNISLNRSFYN